MGRERVCRAARPGPTLQTGGGQSPTSERVGHSGSLTVSARSQQCPTRASHRRNSLTFIFLAVACFPQRMFDPSWGLCTAHPVAMTYNTGKGFVARGATGERSEQCAARESRLAFGLFGCRRRRGRENWLPPCYIQLPLRI